MLSALFIYDFILHPTVFCLGVNCSENHAKCRENAAQILQTQAAENSAGVDILVGARDHVMSLPALPTDVTEACCGTVFGC